MAFQITQEELKDINQQVEDERFIRVLRVKERCNNYTKAYRAAKKPKHYRLKDPPYEVIVDIKGFHFTGITEDICCEEFGCPKILSMREKMFGNRCINHPKNEKL